jgi:hypothetical protein
LSEITSPVSLRINSPVSGSVTRRSDKKAVFDFLLVTIQYDNEAI